LESKDNITQLLAEFTGGNKEAVNSLMPLVYGELHKVAQMHLLKERKDHTLNATALVHEVYFKLIDQTRVNWQNRAHFFAIASQAMRRILINYAYQHKAQKRGGENVIVTFVEENVMRETRPEELIALDEALKQLQEISERQSKIIEYWFFVGLTHEEIAEVLGISVPTVRRDWRLARAWLSRELNKTI
jgi:RNA polymerase sigma factor (TIGR02999 family)